MKRLSYCIAEYIYRCRYVDKDYKEICAYGLELIFSSVIEIVNVLLISILTNTIGYGIIYILLIMGIRSYTGGYHAKTKLMCNFIFVITYLLSLLSLNIVLKYKCAFYILWILLLGAGMYVVKYAPVENVNKTLNKRQKFENRKRSICIYAVNIFLLSLCDIYAVVVGWQNDIVNYYSSYIKIIMIIIALTMIVCKFKIEHTY